MKNTQRRTNLLLLASSTALALAVMETVARALLSAPQQFPYPQLRYRADPALMFTLEPEQRAFTADQPVTINARGLRGALTPYERAPGRQRLLFLGDSITFGWGTRDDEVLTARVVALLGGAGIAAEAINTGVPGYNTEQEVTYLEREGLRYAPDWVIVGVCWNDINDHADVQVDTLGRPTPGVAGWRAPLARAWASETGYAVRNTVKRFRLLWAAREGWFAVLDTLAPDAYSAFRWDVLEGRATAQVEQGWQRLESSLGAIATLAERHGFRPLLAAFPVPLVLQRSFPDSSYPARLHRAAAHAGIPLIDLEPAFRAGYRGHDSLFHPYDAVHPNAAGHAIAAREIARFLVSTGLRAAAK